MSHRSTTNSLLLASAPSLSIGMVDLVASDTIGLLMHQAVLNQRSMQHITNTAVTQVCALIIALGGAHG